MAKLLCLALAALLVVAAMAEVEMEETTADVEFLKRDPEMQEYMMAEKRGRNLRKYKYCSMYDQDCWCSRRTNKIVFCSGIAAGENM